MFNRMHQDMTLTFYYRELDVLVYSVYVHSPEDLPYFNANPLNLRKADADVCYLFNIIEMKNKEDVADLAVHKRNCRFPKEGIDRINMPYSFSSCFLDLRVTIELELCNCTIHTSPKKC